MKPIKSAWLIQIEITNACIHDCAHCTRGVRHIRNPFFGDLDYVERALQSLEGWRHGIGCMGGEPTIHPKFQQICDLYQRYIPQKRRRGLWTSGGKKYEQYKELIHETFGIINFNDHTYHCYHQPLMVGSEELVPDEKLREKLINDCWLQRTWSPTITPRGAFFCEVAATFDLLFDGPGGFSLEKGWWEKGINEMNEQKKRYCRYCSIAIPMETYPDTLAFDYVSPGNMKRLEKTESPALKKENVRVFDKKLSRHDIKNNRKLRPPQFYSEKGTVHFWYKNSLLFEQKLRSFPWKIKSIINRLFL